MRLGVYTDLVYRREGATLSTDLSFIVFVTSLASRVGEIVLFGRLDPDAGRSHYELPHEGVRLVPLPHYGRVTDVGGVVRSFRGARAAFAAELDRLDAVWLFGPHPLALGFERIARRRGKPVFLGIRQDFPQYVAGRLPSRGWLWAVPVAHALEHGFRRLARRGTPTVVVGEDLASRYRGPRVLPTGFSLIRDLDVVSEEEALGRSWDGDELRLLTVGRLESEKNPLLLPEILAALRRSDQRWRLRAVGDGPMAADVEARARELGVLEALDLAGYVPYGETLHEEYRRAHAFLHVSLTEGLPQVLFEAMAAGLPMVATDVGGVRAALGDGARGLLVPPRDAQAAAESLDRLRADPDLRRRLVVAALEHARAETLDAQLDRVAAFFRAALDR